METLHQEMRDAVLSLDSERVAGIFGRYYSERSTEQLRVILADALRTMRIGELASFLPAISPYFKENEIKSLARSAIFKGKRAALTAAADYFADGIMRQFPEKF